MTSEIPKFNLLYYKALLDKCFLRFFDECGDSFTKTEDGLYVLSKGMSWKQIVWKFESYLKDEVLSFAKPYSTVNPNFYLIIGACMPKDNILLKYRDESFSRRLKQFLDSESPLKYVLKEKDIKIDIAKFNSAMLSIFQKMFKNRKHVEHLFGKEYKNIVFVQHAQLDCYSMFKVIKHIYGRSNCWNLHRQLYYNVKSPIVAVNDLIDRNVKDKSKLNSSREFRSIVKEVQNFLDEKVQEISLNG